MGVEKALRFRSPLDIRIVTSLCSLLIIFACFGISGAPDLTGGPYPALASLRLRGTDKHFLDHRAEEAPKWLYHGLHVLPAIAWCIIIPLQHSVTLRSDNTRLHRLLGYVALSLSFILNISGALFLFNDLAYTHEDVFHIHALYYKGRWIPPFAWPTFTGGLIVFSPIFFYSLVRCYQTAGRKNISLHRRWAVLHSIAGLTIAIDRVNLSMVIGTGQILAHLPPTFLRNWVGLPEKNADIVDVELSAFAAAAFYAYVVAAGWIFYEFTRKGSLIARVK